VASVRAQILAVVAAQLDEVREDLEWAGVHRNPREVLGEGQMNALILWDGGDSEPSGLTSHVEQNELEFTVGLLIHEVAGQTAEELLDAGLVAVCDKLLDPANIQLGGLAVSIARGAISEPVIGRADKGSRYGGGQAIDFTVRYMTREGDASTPGP
jgi:hypothetical protein